MSDAGALVASDATLDNFALELKTPPDGSGVVVGYSGIPGNQPQTYGNSVALWDNWNPVIDGEHKTNPLTVVPISGNEQPSTVYVPWRFTGTDYLVTYQVGNQLTSMAAELRLSLSMAAAVEPPSAVSLQVYQLGASSITVVYNTLGGYLPQQFGNWVGVWQGFAGPYFPPTPLAWAPVGSDSTEGLVTVDGLELVAGFVYRVIYFMGPVGSCQPPAPASNLGAVLTFTVGDPAAPVA